MAETILGPATVPPSEAYKMDELERLLKVCGEATPGPWKLGEGVMASGRFVAWVMVPKPAPPYPMSDLTGVLTNRADAEFIATFNPAKVSALLLEVGRLRGALEFYRDNWDWFPGDGETPTPSDPGSPPTFYEAEPNAALRADEGNRAREVLSPGERKEGASGGRLPAHASASEAATPAQHSAGLEVLDASMKRLLKPFPSDVELPDDVAGPITAQGAALVRQLIRANRELQGWLSWYQAQAAALSTRTEAPADAAPQARKSEGDGA